MTNVIKITKNYPNNNPWTGLTRKEAFNLEINCLKILNSNFKCLCDVKCVRNDLISNCELDFNEIPNPTLDNINLPNTKEIKFKLNQ